MPHLVRWHEELGDFGLIIIGLHVQSATDDEIRRTAESLGIRFAVTKGGSVPGSKGSIPQCFLFDPAGECVYEGHPNEVEPKLRSAVGRALVDAAGLSDPARPLKSVVEALQAGTQPPLTALQKLMPLRSTAGPAGEQAKALVEKILENGQRSLDNAKSKSASEPVAAYDIAQRLVAGFKGTPVSAKASELIVKLRTDKAVIAELRARPLLAMVKKIDDALADGTKEADRKSPEFKKINAEQLRRMKSTIQQLKRAYGETPAARAALAIAEKYDLAGK